MDAKQFMAGLPAFAPGRTFGPLPKDVVLMAEVKLPVPVDFKGELLEVTIRRPYCRDFEVIAIDVSRLPLP